MICRLAINHQSDSVTSAFQTWTAGLQVIQGKIGLRKKKERKKDNSSVKIMASELEMWDVVA